MKQFDVQEFSGRFVRAGATSESPLEQIFQMVLEKYLHPRAKLIPQAPLNTHRGSYRADFMLITATGVRLVLECDGKDYHDEVRDGFRDAFTLASKCADYVYRFPGYVIHSKIWHALFTLLLQQPGVFSEYGEREILMRCNHLIDPRELGPERFAYPPRSLKITDDFGLGDELFEKPSVITVRSGVNDRGATLFGVHLVQFTRAHPSCNIAELVELYMKKETPVAFDGGY